MAIELTDGILAQLAKPLDLKTVVGPVDPQTQQFYEYPNKESIPNIERYRGMMVLDVNNLPYRTWRLDNGITDDDWIEISYSGSTAYTVFSLKATSDQKLFDIADEFTMINTVVDINGITLPRSDYTIAYDEVSQVNRILLTFNIERYDELNLTRLS